MSLVKRLEHELIMDWHRLQLETIPELKDLAIKAYYLKFALYRKARAWSLELVSQKETSFL